MSSREPLWFCHECNAEMRPIMLPDPTCALCHSSFVEKIENPTDDPRDFQRNPLADITPGSLPPEIERFLLNLRELMGQGVPRISSPSSVEAPVPDNRFRFEIHSHGPTRSPRSVTIGGSHTLNTRPRTSPGEVPTVSQFRRMNDPSQDAEISGPLMAQYLSAIMGMRSGLDPQGGLLGLGTRDAAIQGRLGEYVFNQEALDQIITHLMETSNASQPVPATEEIISDLPREILELGSPTLQKECAVCKDQFQLETDDPEEQVIVTLPCQHPFHEGCIIPWLKSSGTCPVCRHALIPQPEHHSPQPGAGNSGPSSRSTQRPGHNGPRSWISTGRLGSSSRGDVPGPRSGPDRDSGPPDIPGGWSE